MFVIVAQPHKAADESIENGERKMTNEKNNLHKTEIFTMGKIATIFLCAAKYYEE